MSTQGSHSCTNDSVIFVGLKPFDEANNNQLKRSVSAPNGSLQVCLN